LCITGETTKERIKGIETQSKCYFLNIKPSRFSPQLELTEEQAKKIKLGFFELELSENEQSLSN
jgi:hypothetical protein